MTLEQCHPRMLTMKRLSTRIYCPGGLRLEIVHIYFKQERE